MGISTFQDRRQRERILFVSVMTTFGSLVPSFLVAYVSNSVTLYADFLRCFGEFLAIFISWLIFRKISQGEGGRIKYSYGYGKLEQFASLGVGMAMLLTFFLALFAAIYRFINPAPIDSVGLAVAFTILSIGGNLFVWIKNARLNKVFPSPLIESQAQLFRAKTSISVVVLISLLLTAGLDNTSISPYIDPLGSVFIALFLLYSAFGVLTSSMHDLLDRSLGEVVQCNVLRALVLHEDEYFGYSGMRSRVSGGQTYIEIFLQFRPENTVTEVMQSIQKIRDEIVKVIPGADISIILS